MNVKSAIAQDESDSENERQLCISMFGDDSQESLERLKKSLSSYAKAKAEFPVPPFTPAYKTD